MLLSTLKSLPSIKLDFSVLALTCCICCIFWLVPPLHILAFAVTRITRSLRNTMDFCTLTPKDVVTANSSHAATGVFLNAPLEEHTPSFPERPFSHCQTTRAKLPLLQRQPWVARADAASDRAGGQKPPREWTRVPEPGWPRKEALLPQRGPALQSIQLPELVLMQFQRQE